MPQNHTLNIPADGNLTGVYVNDTVTISFTEERSWCFYDPDNVFANGFLPAGRRSRDYQSPAYTAVNPGTVHFDSVGSGNCDPHGGITLTGHTIVVSGSGVQK